MFSSLKNYLPQTRLAVWYFIFLFFFHFSNNFSLLVTLLFVIIRENLKKLLVDGGWSALCCKFHIIINKVFFSTIIFNPNTCMYIDLFSKIHIYSYTWPEGPLSFAGTNRESELSAWETRSWSRVLLYLQSIEGMCIYSKSLCQQILLCRIWPYQWPTYQYSTIRFSVLLGKIC